MTAATKVFERSVAVEADGRALGLGQILDDLDLEGLVPFALELRDRLGPREILRVLEGQVRGLLLAHLRLDLLEVGRRQRPRQVEVVVEAVADGRTDAELRVREDARARRQPSCAPRCGAWRRGDPRSRKISAAAASWAISSASIAMRRRVAHRAGRSDALQSARTAGGSRRSDRSRGTASGRRGSRALCCASRSTGTRRSAARRARPARQPPGRRRAGVRRREPAQPQPLAALRGDPLARPRRVEADPTSRPRPPSPSAPMRSVTSLRMTSIAGQPTNVGSSSTRDAAVVDRDGADDAEVDQADGRDLRIARSAPARPTPAARAGRAGPATTSHPLPRGTRIVNSPWSQLNSSVRLVRPSGSGTGLRAAGRRSARARARTLRQPRARAARHRLAAGGRQRRSASSAASGAKTAWASAHSVRMPPPGGRGSPALRRPGGAATRSTWSRW